MENWGFYSDFGESLVQNLENTLYFQFGNGNDIWPQIQPMKIPGWSTVKPVLVVTSIKQPTCIKQPEESCPKIHRHIYLNCIKQPPAFSSHILSFPWVAA